MQPSPQEEKRYVQPSLSADYSGDSNQLLTELLGSVSAPLTVVMLTVERLQPGEGLSEADHQLLLQNLDRINRAVKWCNQARNGTNDSNY